MEDPTQPARTAYDDSLYDDAPMTVRQLIANLVAEEGFDLDSYVHVWMPGVRPGSPEVDTVVCEVAPHKSGKGMWLNTVLNRDGRDDSTQPPVVWLTSADPEPEVGTTVETESGHRWVRDDETVVTWFHECHEGDDMESWIKVAGNYGPVRVVAANA